eukprot:7421771-Pyramimonas_sp.AAC.1
MRGPKSGLNTSSTTKRHPELEIRRHANSAAGPPCGFRQGDLRWSSLWGHEALYWVVDDARGWSHWGFRWISLWGHGA